MTAPTTDDPRLPTWPNVAVPLDSFEVELPPPNIPEDVDHETIAATTIKHFDALSISDFTEDAKWRDLLALTGNLRTFSQPKTIALAWKELTATHRPYRFTYVPGTSHVFRMGPLSAWIEAKFTFSLPKGKHPRRECSGMIRLVLTDDNHWKIWILVTMLENIDGYGNVDMMERLPAEQSAKERAESSIDSGKTDFDVAIVGGGPSGLSISGRLKALGVSSVILDRNEEIGGNWLTRYKSLSLHTSKKSSEMPFEGVFLPEDPYFLTSTHIAAGYRRFVEWYGLTFWTSTAVKKASWDEASSTWTIELHRLKYSHHNHGNAATLPRTPITANIKHIRARHLVFAVGGTGQIPFTPSIPNRELFRGDVVHSAHYTDATPWRGKRGVIIGSANTAHDICLDMASASLSSITMVQRSRTQVLPLELQRRLAERAYGPSASVAAADQATQTPPAPVLRATALTAMRAQSARLQHYYAAHEAAGFAADPVVDLIAILMERGGGHWFDVGASQLLFDGRVRVKRGAVSGFSPTGLRFADGSALDADVVVLATGFVGNNMKDVAANIVGPATARRLDEFWHVDAEGELRGVARPHVAQRNVWYMGGDIRFARYWSRYVALQIKAEVEGAPFVPFWKRPGVDGEQVSKGHEREKDRERKRGGMDRGGALL
ncbi:flavin-containing monooxygenase [Phyllosticta citricarpa]|uniref:Flavin-containing monooxygenase n=1 Tax=Phyllosticta citricarpa TaxID=55181 RepID=A0ABR1MPG4_9PEZI